MPRDRIMKYPAVICIGVSALICLAVISEVFYAFSSGDVGFKLRGEDFLSKLVDYSFLTDKVLVNPNVPLKIRPHWRCIADKYVQRWVKVGETKEPEPDYPCERDNQIIFPTENYWKCDAKLGWIESKSSNSKNVLSGFKPMKTCYIGYWECINDVWTKIGNPLHPQPVNSCNELAMRRALPFDNCRQCSKRNADLFLTNDGGHVCGDSSECESFCEAISTELPDIGAIPYLGRCAQFRSKLGCRNRVEEGYASIHRTICMD